MREFSELKVLPMGLSSEPHGHVPLDKNGLNAFFKMWATTGCGVAMSAAWVGTSSVGRRGGDNVKYGPQFFFRQPL